MVIPLPEPSCLEQSVSFTVVTWPVSFVVTLLPSRFPGRSWFPSLHRISVTRQSSERQLSKYSVCERPTEDHSPRRSARPLRFPVSAEDRITGPLSVLLSVTIHSPLMNHDSLVNLPRRFPLYSPFPLPFFSYLSSFRTVFHLVNLSLHF